MITLGMETQQIKLKLKKTPFTTYRGFLVEFSSK